MSDAPPSHLPGQEPCQPVSRSSSAGPSPSTAMSVMSLMRSQSVPVQLPPASISQQQALSAQTLPSPFQDNFVPSQWRLNAIMAPAQSPYMPPYILSGHRIQQQLPPLTSEIARRPSLPPLLPYSERQHQFLMQTPTPNLPPLQPSGGLPSNAASQPPSSLLWPSSTALARSTSADDGMRRPKSHVVTACSNCKKAHLACDGMSRFLLFIYLFDLLSYFCFYGLDFGIGSVCFTTAALNITIMFCTLRPGLELNCPHWWTCHSTTLVAEQPDRHNKVGRLRGLPCQAQAYCVIERKRLNLEINFRRYCGTLTRLAAHMYSIYMCELVQRMPDRTEQNIRFVEGALL
ncbi:uncharacterized protein V1513DRAFT_453703 [Lipomyces chichibuensis]|uniref:uncharacterized protein n=1 Tax=Lipomyces chichibuensis TaxID=1546026 RepID=UPI0033442A51